jgi:hypothetical protein
MYLPWAILAFTSSGEAVAAEAVAITINKQIKNTERFPITVLLLKELGMPCFTRAAIILCISSKSGR